MKEKLVKSLKNLVWLLMVVGVVGVAIVISVRLFAVMRTINSNEPMNQALLPQTYTDGLILQYRPVQIKNLKERVDDIYKKINDIKGLIQQLQKQSKPTQLEEVFLLKEEIDELPGRINEMRRLLQQLQGRSEFPQDEEMRELYSKVGNLEREFSEIQARIQKLQKQTDFQDPQEKNPE